MKLLLNKQRLSAEVERNGSGRCPMTGFHEPSGSIKAGNYLTGL